VPRPEEGRKVALETTGIDEGAAREDTGDGVVYLGFDGRVLGLEVNELHVHAGFSSDGVERTAAELRPGQAGRRTVPITIAP
jgi:hypothetical protein